MRSKKRPRSNPSTSHNEIAHCSTTATGDPKSLTILWIAAKRHDSIRICKCLLNHSALDEDRMSGECSLLASTDKALALHNCLFDDGCNEDTVNDDDDDDDAVGTEEEIPDLSDSEKRLLYLRALLLLPAYSSTPWDAIKSYLHLMYQRAEERDMSGCDLAVRQTLGEVRIFLSSVCQGGSNGDDDGRTIHAQRNEIEALCRMLVKPFYIHAESESASIVFSIVEDSFQLLISVFHASVRINDCLKRRVADNDTIHGDGMMVPLTEHVLNAIYCLQPLNNDGDGDQPVFVRSSMLPSLLSLSCDLRRHLSSKHWSSLQRLIIHHIRREGTIDGYIPVACLKSIMNFSVAQIAIRHIGESDHVLMQWLELILVVYHVSTFHQHTLEEVEMVLCASLPNLPSKIVNLFVNVTIGKHQSAAYEESSFIDMGTFEVPCWVRANMLLLIFVSRRSIMTVQHLVTKLPGSQARVDGEENYTVTEAILDLIQMYPEYIDDDVTRRRPVLSTQEVITEFQRTVYSDSNCCRRSFDCEDAMQNVATRLQRILTSIMLIVEASVSLGRRESSCSDSLINSCCWKRRDLWKSTAHQIMESKTASASSGVLERAVAAGAILIVLFRNDLSSRETLLQDIVDSLCKRNSANLDDVDTRLIYCWILKVIARVEALCNGDGDSSDMFRIFAPVYVLVQSRGDGLLPRRVIVELMRSLACIQRGRDELLIYSLQEIEYESLWAQCSDSNDERSYRGLDGLILLLRVECCTDGVLDLNAFRALSFISDEIAAKQSIMTVRGRSMLLTLLLSTINEGLLHTVAMERITNAALGCLLAYFRPCRDDPNKWRGVREVVFVPNRLVCQNEHKPGKSTSTQEELLLLVQLLIAAFQYGPMSQSSSFRDAEICFLLENAAPMKSSPFAISDGTLDNETGQEVTRQIAIACFGAMIRYLSNDMHLSEHYNIKRSEDGRDNDDVCSELWEALCLHEKVFWEQARVDPKLGTMGNHIVEGPKWIKSPPAVIHSDAIHVNQLSSPILSSMSTIFVTSVLSSMNRSPAGTITTLEEYNRLFYLSFAANSILHGSWASRESVDANPVMRHETAATLGNQCSAVAAYFASTANICNALDTGGCQEYQEKIEYMGLVLPATLHACYCLDRLLCANNLDRSHIIKMYRSLVEFHFSVCSESRSRAMVDVLGTTTSEDRKSNHSIAPDNFVLQLRLAVLSSLEKLLLYQVVGQSVWQSELAKVSDERNDEFVVYFNLLYELCKDLSSGLQETSGRMTNALCRKYMKVIEKSLDKVYQMSQSQIVCFGDSDTANDWIEKSQAAATLLWDALQSCDIQNKALVEISTFQIPQLLRLINRNRVANFLPETAKNATQAFDKGLGKRSLATTALDLCTRDLETMLSNSKNSTVRLVWLKAGDTKMNEWTSLFCLANVEQIWMESSQIITRTATGIATGMMMTSEQFRAQNPMVAKYARIHLSELRAILSSVALLQTIGPLEPTMKQRLCTFLEKIVTTLKHAIACISRYYKEPDRSRHGSYVVDLAIVEAFVCLIAWLKVSPTDEVASLTETDFVSGAKLWCNAKFQMKDNVHSKRLTKVLNRIIDLEGSLLKLYTQLKGGAALDNDRSVETLVTSLLSQDEEANLDLTDAIDDYCKATGLVIGSERKAKLVTTNSPVKEESKLKTKNDRIKKRIRANRKGRQRSRNSVIDEWLDLDRGLLENGANDGYEDLEGFILPG